MTDTKIVTNIDVWNERKSKIVEALFAKNMIN